MNERKGRPPQLFLTLNGVLLVSLIVFLTLFLQDEKMITAIPPLVYWLLIALGVLLGIFSVSVDYVPGQLTSAAVLFFMGFIAIFSIGVVLIVLAVIELWIAFIQYKRSDPKLNA